MLYIFIYIYIYVCINFFLQDIYSPLQIATSNGHTEIVRCLADNGADVNAPIKVREIWSLGFEKKSSHGVRRNDLSKRKQRLNRSLDDLCELPTITVNMSFFMHCLLFRI